MPKNDPVMTPVQFSLRAAMIATLVLAVASAALSPQIRRLDETERWRAAFLTGGILAGVFVGAGMASFARAKILRIAGKRLLVVPAGNTGIPAMKVGMVVIVVLWCAVVWVFGMVRAPYLTFLSVLIAFPIRWLCRFPRYLELFENGLVYGGTVYFPWKRFSAFRFDGNSLQLDFLLDKLDLSVPAEYVSAVDEILSRHIERWQAPPRDWFAAEQDIPGSSQ
jgi:hypothetical protein